MDSQKIIEQLLGYAANELRPPAVWSESKDDVGAAVNYPFRLSERAVEYAEESDNGDVEWRFVCSRLKVGAVTRNEDSEEWGRLLVFLDDDGREHQWSMPMEMLAGDG